MATKTSRKLKYLTGFTTTQGSVDSSFQGQRWRIIFIEHRSGFSQGAVIGKRIIPVKHLLIETYSPGKAKQILDLIYACWVVLNGCDYIGYDLHDLYNLDLITLDEKPNIFPQKMWSDEIYDAGIMATKASFRDSYVYAIQKLCFSYQTYGAAPIDLDPHQGNLPTPNLAKPFPPSIRIRIADAIVSAYSAVEELGLDIHASGNDPLKDKRGNWLPEKREEMISRLKQASINVDETFIWDLRGGRKCIEEKKVFTQRGKKSPWSFGLHVRDEEIELVDAIDRASFLRSQIASHKFSSTKSGKKKLIKVLSIYDVANVQFLARRLILESLKLWRV